MTNDFTPAPKRFRVWDLQEKCWATDAENLLWSKDGSVYLGNVRDNSISFVSFGEHRFVRLQSTGLTDADGVEVFEGDIVSVLWDDGPGRPYVVTFEDGGWTMSGGLPLGSRLAQTVRVAGNVYEHPERLGRETVSRVPPTAP